MRRCDFGTAFFVKIAADGGDFFLDPRGGEVPFFGRIGC